uniref:Putative secreted protein n=1 Tax=Anopheles darlingi TaxID=43151 RepID=A0A2M4D5X0_ANODA
MYFMLHASPVICLPLPSRTQLFSTDFFCPFSYQNSISTFRVLRERCAAHPLLLKCDALNNKEQPFNLVQRCPGMEV